MYDCSIILSFYLKKKSNKILNFVALLTIYYFGGITKTQPSVFSLTVFLQQFCTLLYRYRDRSLKPDKTTLCQHVLKYYALFSYFFFLHFGYVNMLFTILYCYGFSAIDILNNVIVFHLFALECHTVNICSCKIRSTNGF